jgi:hypothetical protein
MMKKVGGMKRKIREIEIGNGIDSRDRDDKVCVFVCVCM